MAATTTMMIPASSFYSFLPKSVHFVLPPFRSRPGYRANLLHYTTRRDDSHDFLGLFIFLYVCLLICAIKAPLPKKPLPSFWNRENEANHTRRKDISGLPYITIPLADFPMGIYDNPELKI